MMGRNPFDSLYLGESVSPSDFVRIFSPLVATDTESLFGMGNVVLKGTQGSGKSMLLSLLKPETRISFERAKTTFPPDARGDNFFLGAGINLTRSGAIDFVNRIPLRNDMDESKHWEHIFGDFINFWIARDLLRGLRLLSSSGLQANIDCSRLDEFAHEYSRSAAWLGAVVRCDSYAELSKQLDERITGYRHFLNFNTQELPDGYVSTKTSPGEPISALSDALRATGVVNDRALLIVRIDQYEELMRHSLSNDSEVDLSSVIHRMLGSRDQRVAYKIGTRRYAWPRNPQTRARSGALEQYRDYTVVDLDEILRKPEQGAGKFSIFMQDVFSRRLEVANIGLGQHPTLQDVFGKTAPAGERARRYAESGGAFPRVSGLSDSVLEYINYVAQVSPLDAILARAWLLQGKEVPPIGSDEDFPWRKRKAQWWLKERQSMALVQLAAERQQSLIYGGAGDIETLADCNILVFLSLCQHIWSAWSRTTEAKGGFSDTFDVPHLAGNSYVQNLGIYQASKYWYRKIQTDPGGDSRAQFVRNFGLAVRESYRTDRRMSYPGGNAISLMLSDLDRNPDFALFLQEAAAHGVLIDREHRSKNAKEGLRSKWRLHNIYSPYLQLPMTFVKEPRYFRASQVRTWLGSEGGPGEAPGEDRETPRYWQEQLFDAL